jgi:hypothetical protein
MLGAAWCLVVARRWLQLRRAGELEARRAARRRARITQHVRRDSSARGRSHEAVVASPVLPVSAPQLAQARIVVMERDAAARASAHALHGVPAGPGMLPLALAASAAMTTSAAVVRPDAAFAPVAAAMGGALAVTATLLARRSRRRDLENG